jgi:pimeloyl-ACP methyl ester carboxylesterase
MTRLDGVAETLLLVVALVALAFVAGAWSYVAATYVLAHRHAPRALRGAAADMATELSWTVLVQPLLPLYWLFGRRMASVLRGREALHLRPVIFVHGYAQNRVDFVRLARALRRRGFAHLFGFNYPWLVSVAANARRLARFADEVRAETGADQVDLVCHSMGGLVAMQYLHGEGGAERVSRCVTIATPFRGVRWRGPLLGRAASDLRQGFAFPDRPPEGSSTRMLSIYSRHDNVVHPIETSQLGVVGGRDHDAGTMGHLAILFEPAVAEVVADFLAEEAPPRKVDVALRPGGEAAAAAAGPT